MQDLTKNDIEWLERHGFKLYNLGACYQRNVGGQSLNIYYSVTSNAIVCICMGNTSFHGEGKTAEEAYLDFLHKNKVHIEELQSFQNELVKI